MNKTVFEKFSLKGRVAVITGGGGLLGAKHAEALTEAGAVCVLADINLNRAQSVADSLRIKNDTLVLAIETDITNPDSVHKLLESTIKNFGKVDILINNAANNPHFDTLKDYNRFESFPISAWNQDIAVGLTGAFLCSQIIGDYLATSGNGVILNIASDLALIGPDQRIYKIDGIAENQQPTKPVTYSIVKSGLIGLTRYLATYWAERGVRVNALVPGGVYDSQDQDFVEKLVQLIPLGRMADVDEYKAAIVFLCSEASSYMTGSLLVIDGGRTCW